MYVASDPSKARPSSLDGVDYAQLVLETKFNVSELARSRGVSVRQLERYFKFRFGLRPHEFVERQRLAHAKALLRTGEPVKAVSFVLSFKQPSSFTRAFARFYGYAPSKERAMALMSQKDK